MPDLIARLAFNTRVRSRIWKQLAKLLQNRMHLHEALRLLKFQAEERKSPLVKVYAHILHKLGRGRTLGAALDGPAAKKHCSLARLKTAVAWREVCCWPAKSWMRKAVSERA